MSEVKYQSLEKQIGNLADMVNATIYDQRKYLLGKVLTIVDSAISDKEQRKATKDLIQDMFYQGSYWNSLKEVFDDFLEANGYEKSPEGGAIESSMPNRFIKRED